VDAVSRCNVCVSRNLEKGLVSVPEVAGCEEEERKNTGYGIPSMFLTYTYRYKQAYKVHKRTSDHSRMAHALPPWQCDNTKTWLGKPRKNLKVSTVYGIIKQLIVASGSWSLIPTAHVLRGLG